MPEINRLSDDSDAIELDFVEREGTPKRVMRLAIHPHLSILPISNKVRFFDTYGIFRAGSTVHS